MQSFEHVTPRLVPPVYTYRFFGMFRLFLAGLVMLQHFAANAAPIQVALALRPFEPGSLAVYAFFCLSGFVIAESADIAYRGRPKAFLGNRMLRILPHFIIAMILSILLQAWFAHHGQLRVERDMDALSDDVFQAHNILFNFLSILPGMDRLVSYNFVPIAWAVRIEVAFYLVIFACLWIADMLAKDKTDGFALACGLALALLTPPFILSVLHKAPPMLGFIPYFAYGAALYFTFSGRSKARLIACLCLPAIAWHFVSLPAAHPTLGFTRDVRSQMVILLLLLMAITLCAGIRGGKLKGMDNAAGTITYPLYLYHYVVLVVFSSALDYSWGQFSGGMLASLLFAYAMSYLFDPVIDRWRDKIRGRKLKTAASENP